MQGCLGVFVTERNCGLDDKLTPFLPYLHLPCQIPVSPAFLSYTCRETLQHSDSLSLGRGHGAVACVVRGFGEPPGQFVSGSRHDYAFHPGRFLQASLLRRLRVTVPDIPVIQKGTVHLSIPIAVDLYLEQRLFGFVNGLKSVGARDGHVEHQGPQWRVPADHGGGDVGAELQVVRERVVVVLLEEQLVQEGVLGAGPALEKQRSCAVVGRDGHRVAGGVERDGGLEVGGMDPRLPVELLPGEGRVQQLPPVVAGKANVDQLFGISEEVELLEPVDPHCFAGVKRMDRNSDNSSNHNRFKMYVVIVTKIKRERSVIIIIVITMLIMVFMMLVMMIMIMIVLVVEAATVVVTSVAVVINLFNKPSTRSTKRNLCNDIAEILTHVSG